MPYKTVNRLRLSAGNGANGFPARLLVSCIRSSSHKSEAFQKDKKTDSCLPWNNKSASLAFLYPNELRIHHTSTQSSWLNMSEIEFSALSPACLKGRNANADAP